MFVYVCVYVKGMYELEWKFVTAAFHMLSSDIFWKMKECISQPIKIEWRLKKDKKIKQKTIYKPAISLNFALWGSVAGGLYERSDFLTWDVISHFIANSKPEEKNQQHMQRRMENRLIAGKSLDFGSLFPILIIKNILPQRHYWPKFIDSKKLEWIFKDSDPQESRRKWRCCKFCNQWWTEDSRVFLKYRTEATGFVFKHSCNPLRLVDFCRNFVDPAILWLPAAH